jgi:hypothetical protein
MNRLRFFSIRSMPCTTSLGSVTVTRAVVVSFRPPMRTIILFRISTDRGWREAGPEGPDSAEDAGEVDLESKMNAG